MMKSNLYCQKESNMRLKMLEGKVQESIISYLKKNRIYHFRFQAQSNLNGLPDIICLYKGFFIGLELKREKGGTPTGLQLRKIKAINDNGGIGLIVRSVYEVEMLLDVINDYYTDNNICSEDILAYYEIRKNENEKK